MTLDQWFIDNISYLKGNSAMHPTLADLAVRMLRVARDLTEPDDPNDEYVRGQVNLIMDMTGFPPDALDCLYLWYTDVITSRVPVPTTAELMEVVTVYA